MQTKSIQFLVYPRISLLDLAGPLEVFIAANYLARSPLPPYLPSIIALRDTPEVFSGFSINAEILEAGTPSAHTLIVPGGAGIQAFCKDSRFFSHFVEHAHNAQRLVSVCTGILALATAGKLEGRTVTTHWSAYDELESAFPSVVVKRGPIFINDGDVWTSAGVTSGIDMALAIVENDLGHAAALEVARHLVVFLKRPGGQEQFSSSLALQSQSSHFSDLHAWLNNNLGSDLSVSVMADFMKMGERTFARRYTESTGRTPSKMVESLRLDAVRHLLVTSDSPLKSIAKSCGLGNESTLIRRFVKQVGVTPAAYRARFGSQQ